MRHNKTLRPQHICILATCLLLASCASIGPNKIPSDRNHYNRSITESWKEQILLNIVKIRYVEPLFFVDVGEIVAGYSLETGGNLGFSRDLFDLPANSDSSSFQLGMSGKFTDRPTITYRPMTGARFLKGIMSPIPLQNVLMGIDSGVSADFLMGLGIRSINGLRNRALAVSGDEASGSSFQRLVAIIARLQNLDALHISMRTVPPSKRPGLYMSLGTKKPSPLVASLVEEMRNLLDLDPQTHSYALVSGHSFGDRKTISLQTYSLMQMLAIVAVRVDIPEQDVTTHCATPGFSGTSGSRILDTVAVHVADTRPDHAFSAVPYHDHWFWIDDHDLTTKRIFSFLMLAFTLLEKDTSMQPLQLTLPAQ